MIDMAPSRKNFTQVTAAALAASKGKEKLSKRQSLQTTDLTYPTSTSLMQKFHILMLSHHFDADRGTRAPAQW